MPGCRRRDIWSASASITRLLAARCCGLCPCTRMTLAAKALCVSWQRTRSTLEDAPCPRTLFSA